MSYRISKYDPVSEDPEDGCDWYEVAEVDRPMQLRPHIRDLRAQAYSEFTIVVDLIREHPRETRGIPCQN